MIFKAPNPPPDDPTLHELPPIVVDGIPTPVEKMTQVVLSDYSTGNGHIFYPKFIYFPRG